MNSKRRLSLVALLASPVAAAAQPASGACIGDDPLPDHDRINRTTVIRSGGAHAATIVKTDPNGTIHLEQHGQNHASVLIQSGGTGGLVISQSGASAAADVTQEGACSSAELSQAGAGNTATVRQSGIGNRVVVRQGPSFEGGRP